MHMRQAFAIAQDKEEDRTTHKVSRHDRLLSAILPIDLHDDS
jgi:hypothetical protein